MTNSPNAARPARGRHRRENRNVRNAVVAVATVGAAAAAPLFTSTAAHAESVWDRVAACESSGNWQINTGNGFYGGLQFTHSTWQAFGGGAYAYNANGATKAQQIEIARRTLAVQGPHAWPICSIKAGLTSSNGGATSAPVSNPAPAQVQKSVTPKTTPKKSTPAPSSSSTSSSSSSSTSTPPASPPAHHSTTSTSSSSQTSSTADGTIYVVKSGDYLSKIAAQQHVKGGWPALYKANKKVVGADPNLIFPGQKLVIG